MGGVRFSFMTESQPTYLETFAGPYRDCNYILLCTPNEESNHQIPLSTGTNVVYSNYDFKCIHYHIHYRMLHYDNIGN